MSLVVPPEDLVELVLPGVGQQPLDCRVLVVTGMRPVATVVVIGVAVVGAAILWVIWKAKWLILGILGLEALFGGGGDDVA